MYASRRPVRALYSSLEPSTCLACQWRSLAYTARARASSSSSSPQPKPEHKIEPSSLDEAPRAYGKAVEKFDPKPLPRPLGLSKPPRAGENSGIDTRTWRQRRDDFVNYDKHIARRRILTKKMSTPYFREWSNMRHHKGKSFLAPPALFKADKSLYFPNLHGRTLIKSKKLFDTTPTLKGKVSVVSMFSSAWAEKQVASFASTTQNPELHQIIKASDGVAQIVQINVEENALKALLINLFLPNLRKINSKEDWSKYFIVKKGLTDEMKEAIGLLNSKVGYTYLLDGECKIRWAGSGVAQSDEKQGLLKGIRRLIEDAKSRRPSTPRIEEVEEVEDEKPAIAAAA